MKGCLECGAPITKWSKTGRCSPCNCKVITQLPQSKAAQRESGRRATESGQLARIRKLPQTKAAWYENGRRNGRRNVESGNLARIRELPQTKAARRENGRRMVETGEIVKLSFGIPCVTEDGILVKSLDEVAFYSAVRALGGEPKYEPIVIDNYTPDFILGKSVLGLPANAPIELKPNRKWRKIRGSKQRIAEGVLILYADELWTLGPIHSVYRVMPEGDGEL